MKRGRTTPCRGGNEYDSFTRWKQMLGWDAGERKAIKRGYNRRSRKKEKELLRDLTDE